VATPIRSARAVSTRGRVSRRRAPGRQLHALVGPLAARHAELAAIAAEEARRNGSNAPIWSSSLPSSSGGRRARHHGVSADPLDQGGLSCASSFSYAQ
jgi:hypothetical protein